MSLFIGIIKLRAIVAHVRCALTWAIIAGSNLKDK